MGIENERLKLIRKALGYNQLDFALSIGLTQGGYSEKCSLLKLHLISPKL
jgi:transcriptional regulator with XRE-family HTH domain